MEDLTKKIIVIMGPTASGKSDLAIALARRYNGEIISADSRQVYRGMDIGTGKVTKAEQKLAKHHLIDVASPKRNYNVTHFIRDAKKATADIQKRNRTPIICGGTGFWIQALIENNSFPAVKPNQILRKKLSKLSTAALFSQLREKDRKRAETIDPKNRIRLIRALEIIEILGVVPPKKAISYKLKTNNYLIISLNPPKEILDRNIETRLEKRLRKGMLAEVKQLRAGGLSFKKLENFGLEYKYLALFLQKKISKDEMKKRLNFEIRHYAKRQITWLKRFEKLGAPIHWITTPQEATQILQEKM